MNKKSETLTHEELRRIEALQAAIYFHRQHSMKLGGDETDSVLQNAARFEEWIKQAKP